MSYSWIDFTGNIGVVLILAAYLLLQLNKLSSNQLSYSVLNGVGALLILVSLAFDFNLSAFAIEFFWLLISIVGIVNYYRSNKASITEERLESPKESALTKGKVDL
ncbi:CBU_0592 family membrane protein [Methylophaga sp. OBS4]|uniref:CBU_0592 family membrane protein n=1 Tax=Methylophaga sp. OBS4 TaxID=2991935 RepID=UPI002259EAF2|nr:hypothetical protein [Methylophaga sp. OBS4]MCX4188598.1 hypothetical protein [Methylophaga sp. OBS4]